jgi:hypothetical protein
VDKKTLWTTLIIVGFGVSFFGGLYMGSNAGSAERAKLEANVAKYQQDLATSRIELNDIRAALGRAQNANRESISHVNAGSVGISNAIGNVTHIQSGVESSTNITHSLRNGIDGDIDEVGIALKAVRLAQSGLQQLQNESGSRN